MNNHLKVLKLFVDNKDNTFTIKKAAEALKINYRIVYEEIMKLEKDDVATRTEFIAHSFERFSRRGRGSPRRSIGMPENMGSRRNSAAD